MQTTALEKSLALLSDAEKKRGYLVLFVVLGVAIFETLGVASIMPFLAVLGNPKLIQSNVLLKEAFLRSNVLGVRDANTFLLLLALTTFILVICSAVYRIYATQIINKYICSIHHNLSMRILRCYLRQPYEFFVRNNSGNLTKNIISEVSHVTSFVLHPMLLMVAYSIQAFAIIVMLFIVDYSIAIAVSAILGGLYYIFFVLMRRKINTLGKVLVNANRQRYIFINEIFGGIKEIKFKNNENRFIERFKRPSEELANSQASYQTLTQGPKYIIEAIVFGGALSLIIVLMLIGGGNQPEALGYALPVVGLYALSAYRLQPALQNMFNGFSGLKYGVNSVENLFDTLTLRTETKETEDKTIKSMTFTREIELRNVGFSYGSRSSPAIKDLSLKIPAKSVVGIVGRSGSGKTTLVDLILGLLYPTEGAIYVDGIVLDEDLIPSWKKTVGYVPQEVYLGDTTIAENIAWGDDVASIDFDRVKSAAQLANLDDFINRELPMKYNTRVGERGVQFSGGQKQRIGVARALYSCPDIIILDEATSALDSICESEIMKEIALLGKTKTIIMISHRIESLKECSSIVMLDSGRVMAVGSFADLVATNEEFRRLNDGE